MNELIARGLVPAPERGRFEQRTSEGHALIEVTNVAEALDVLDGPAGR